jgi:hypothetical protein
MLIINFHIRPRTQERCLQLAALDELIAGVTRQEKYQNRDWPIRYKCFRCDLLHDWRSFQQNHTQTESSVVQDTVISASSITLV